ncbi:polyprenyl synthetase family protein [Nocardia sp. XZ_19_385]|uniref:polyprenyl synthetase family protein n=1 Tax=Nocardia sp. XZ_19_385 TaxID=2769488 RepID=UPI001890965C|nr:polyprenyl synthetase family protein [Nocardia sp. XZ_19_385]
MRPPGDGTTALPDQLLAECHGWIDDALSEFLSEKQRRATIPELRVFVGWLQDFLAGGKRLRPLLCCCGWWAVAGQRVPSRVISVAAALELFHAFALLHDDVMDGSATRRGRPVMHRQIALSHPTHSSADRLGVNTAILVGDLALGWSYDLLHTAGLDTGMAEDVWALLDAMRTETMSGQYLDLLSEGDLAADLDTALAIARYKTGQYTVEKPLRLGAVLAGADESLLASCSSYALPLGEAFQLRDDLLGVFGDPTVTGKPVLDDLRAGKHTTLIAVARRDADSRQRRGLDRLVGDPNLDEDGARQVREILIACGARDAIEAMIADRCHQARLAVDGAPFHPSAAAVLHDLASTCTRRAR